MTRPRPRESDRRLRHNFRLARLLQFLELVSGRGSWNPKNLIGELGVSERTVYRLRETLELAGVPIYFAKAENAYRVRAGYRFPALHLTDDEAFGQAAATALAGSAVFKLPSGPAATTRKLAESASERVRRILEDVTPLTRVLDLKIADHPRQRETIATVQRALLDRRVLACEYRSPYEPGPVTLDLHPYRLVLVKQAWYLIARPDDKDRPRTYRVVRFRSLSPLDRPAAIPVDFDLRGYFGNAWSVFRGDTSHQVELRFSADAAEAVTEHLWHHTQRSEWHPTGEVSLSFTVDGLNEILRWVVGWAGRVRVVRPTELRDLVVGRHRQAAAANEAGS